MRQRRPEYDSDRFREQWMSGVTLADMAAEYGVTVAAIWQAARRRGLPQKNFIKAR
jgi:hypothetical protein